MTTVPYVTPVCVFLIKLTKQAWKTQNKLRTSDNQYETYIYE